MLYKWWHYNIKRKPFRSVKLYAAKSQTFTIVYKRLKDADKKNKVAPASLLANRNKRCEDVGQCACKKHKKRTFGAWTKAGFNFQALKHTACPDLHSFTYRTCQHRPSSSTYLLTCDFVCAFFCICASVSLYLYFVISICVVVCLYLSLIICLFLYLYLYLHICRYLHCQPNRSSNWLTSSSGLVCDQFMYQAWNLNIQTHT